LYQSRYYSPWPEVWNFRKFGKKVDRGRKRGILGSEVGIEESTKNLMGNLREFHRKCMYFCYSVYEIPRKSLMQFSMPTSDTGLLETPMAQFTGKRWEGFWEKLEENAVGLNENDDRAIEK
jgi:hypothetical protein